jgi:hypothetical protein
MEVVTDDGSRVQEQEKAMKHTVITTIIGLAAAPALLAAQGTTTQGTVKASQSTQVQVSRPQASVAQQTDAQATAQASTPQARIDAAVRSASKANIPTSLLTSKVAEGRAKHVADARIATAVEARLHSLQRASAALKQANVDASDASALSVSADALEAGVSQNALVSLERGAPSSRRVVAVAVLTDLVRLGKSSDAALAQVNGAVSSNQALANLNAQVASQLRLGGLTSTLDATGLVHVP